MTHTHTLGKVLSKKTLQCYKIGYTINHGKIAMTTRTTL
jgi:hypothetical protein